MLRYKKITFTFVKHFSCKWCDRIFPICSTYSIDKRMQQRSYSAIHLYIIYWIIVRCFANSNNSVFIPRQKSSHQNISLCHLQSPPFHRFNLYSCLMNAVKLSIACWATLSLTPYYNFYIASGVLFLCPYTFFWLNHWWRRRGELMETWYAFWERK